MRTKLFSAAIWRLRLPCFGRFVLVSRASGQTLRQVTKFDLPGPGGKRFDYLTIDEGDHYLLSAHLAADQTYVIDLGTNKVVATITDTPRRRGSGICVRTQEILYVERARQHHRRGSISSR